MILHIFSVILGALLWTFVEYILHHFAGHEWANHRLLFFMPINHFKKEHIKHHLHQHFADSYCNDGVMTPLWDVFFKIYQPTREAVIPVNSRYALKWMSVCGKIKSSYEDD